MSPPFHATAHVILRGFLAVLLAGARLPTIEAEMVRADLLIVGGTESGCAAAIQAARMGVRSIILVNDIEWLGGQFSAEGLCAIDENRGPEGYGHGVPFPRAGLFAEVMREVEQANLRRFGRSRPGNTRVITTCLPSDAEAAFRRLLKPYLDRGQIRVFSRFAPESVILDESRRTVQGVRFHRVNAATDEDHLTIAARLTIDASDWGDVIRLAGAEYESGPDLQGKYGEPLAPTVRRDYPTTDMNPITYCMVLRETADATPIPRPGDYDPRNYRHHSYPKDPLWLYASRRLVDHYGYPEITHPDVLLLCFPAFDYPLDRLPLQVADAIDRLEPGASARNIVDMTRAQREIIFEDAKRYALGFLYYLQTEVHESMADQTHSFRRFRLTDEFGTPDRLPPKPYVRESLRLIADYMMRQQDTTGHGDDARNYASVMYHDGVACWQFEYDFHPTRREFIDEGDPSGPWRASFRKLRTWGPPYSGRALFPVRSLVPRRLDGLLGSQKNLGFSSIVSSAVRLHDQSMAIGQAAGAVAAVALQHNVAARTIPWRPELLDEVWQGLCQQRDGAIPQILWPFGDLAPEHPAFVAANQLAIRRALPLQCTDIEFHAERPADPQWRRQVRTLTQRFYDVNEPPSLPQGTLTRGEFARHWWNLVRELPQKPCVRRHEQDADGDEIPDVDDPLPLDEASASWPAFAIPADQDGRPETANMRFGFNFTGTPTPVDGFRNDYGRKYDVDSGHGWQRDISQSHRQRRRYSEPIRDTFLFTRSHDVWEFTLPDGTYRVTVCVGDAAHDQHGQNVTIEGRAILRNANTTRGRFRECVETVEITDGRLTLEIGLPDSTTNTCLNWLTIAPVAVDDR